MPASDSSHSSPDTHTTHRPNRMMRLANKVSPLPERVRTLILSQAFGRIVPMVGTAHIRYERVTANEVICTLPNRRPMQNHIKGLHAAAMALLAETASGFVVGVNVPDDHLMLIKTMQVNYRKIAKGSLRAVATLTEAQRQLILTTPKGEVDVAVTVTDEAGNEPIECRMLWAWIPKKRD